MPATLTYKQIKSQLAPGWIVQLGSGKQAKYLSLRELFKYCFRTKRWAFDPNEVNAYHVSTSMSVPFVALMK